VNCAQVDELLAAYALSALSVEETGAMRLHLAECRRHDAELMAHQEAAQRLPLAADEIEPSPPLRARLLDAFDAEADARVARPVPMRARPQPWARPVFAYLAAAVLLLAVIGLAAWNVTLQLGGGESTMRATLTGTAGTGELVYSRQDHLGILALDLPALPANRTYQAWKIGPDGTVSLGLVLNSGANGFVADMSGATAIAVSEEPAGGSGQPTTSPLLIAELP